MENERGMFTNIPIDLPDGSYIGYWTECSIIIPNQERAINFNVGVNLKGENTVRVIVKDKKASLIVE